MLQNMRRLIYLEILQGYFRMFSVARAPRTGLFAVCLSEGFVLFLVLQYPNERPQHSPNPSDDASCSIYPNLSLPCAFCSALLSVLGSFPPMYLG